jgi:hypothetical protein
MEDSDKAVFDMETLGEQYANVKTETDKSHVLEFGDTTIKNLVIGDFEGDVDKEASAG